MADHPPVPTITVGAFLADEGLAIPLDLVGGRAGLARLINHARIQKSGLALAGHFYGVVPTRVQVLGETEMEYLHSLSSEKRLQAIQGFFSLGLALVVVTAQKPIPFVAKLVAEAEAVGVPLVLSAVRSSHTIAAIHLLLDERLAPRAVIHGVLVDVFGQGILLLGKSGIGKSECALELVMRGHRLVADDVVHCDWRPPGMVFGAPAELLRHHIEVRGLGVLNLKHLLGVTSIRERKRIDLVVHLLEWSADTHYDRMGVEDRYHEILNVKLHEIRLPLRPGRSMATIIEVAARRELMRGSGGHVGGEFFARLNRTLVGVTNDSDSESLYPSSPFPPGEVAWQERGGTE